MTEEERREMARSNFAMQMAGLGYDPSGNPLPPKKPEPVEHGKWENGHCSCCGEYVAGVLDTWTNVQKFMYCPKCGARMDLEE